MTTEAKVDRDAILALLNGKTGIAVQVVTGENNAALRKRYSDAWISPCLVGDLVWDAARERDNGSRFPFVIVRCSPEWARSHPAVMAELAIAPNQTISGPVLIRGEDQLLVKDASSGHVHSLVTGDRIEGAT